MSHYMPEAAEQNMRELNNKLLDYVENNKEIFGEPYEYALMEEGVSGFSGNDYFAQYYHFHIRR